MSPNEQASRRRRQVCALVEHLGQLADRAQGRCKLLAGTLYERWRRCGKNNCRCVDGKLHAARVFSIHEGGVSRQVSIAGIDWEELALYVQANREFRRTRAEIARTCAELMETVDQLGNSRRISLDELRRASR